MYRYHPRSAPDRDFWLSLDEDERIRLVEAFHRSERVKLPSIKAHAAFHVVVENQLAEMHEPAVRAMDRLLKQGLARHECVHAIAWVVSQHLYEAMNMKKQDSQPVSQARYDAAVERLDAASWRALASGGENDA